MQSSYLKTVCSFLVLLLGFAGWDWSSAQPTADHSPLLRSDPSVHLSSAPWIMFSACWVQASFLALCPHQRVASNPFRGVLPQLKAASPQACVSEQQWNTWAGSSADLWSTFLCGSIFSTTLFCKLQMPRCPGISALSPQIRESIGFYLLPISAPEPRNSSKAVSWGSYRAHFHLFHFLERSLSFTAQCPLSWNHHFIHFVHFTAGGWIQPLSLHPGQKWTPR